MLHQKKLIASAKKLSKEYSQKVTGELTRYSNKTLSKQNCEIITTKLDGMKDRHIDRKKNKQMAGWMDE